MASAAHSETQTSKKEVVVLGAGVVGLTTALKLQAQGYSVTVIADTIPGDPKSIRYTSAWAGAHHVFHALDGTKWHDHEARTFDVMWEDESHGSVPSH